MTMEEFNKQFDKKEAPVQQEQGIVKTPLIIKIIMVVAVWYGVLFGIGYASGQDASKALEDGAFTRIGLSIGLSAKSAPYKQGFMIGYEAGVQ